MRIVFNSLVIVGGFVVLIGIFCMLGSTAIGIDLQPDSWVFKVFFGGAALVILGLPGSYFYEVWRT